MITQPHPPKEDLGANVTNEILNSLLLQPITAKFIDQAVCSYKTLAVLKLFTNRHNASNVYHYRNADIENLQYISKVFDKAIRKTKKKHWDFYCGVLDCVDEALYVLDYIESRKTKRVKFEVKYGEGRWGDLELGRGNKFEAKRRGYLIDAFKTLVIHKIFLSVVHLIKDNPNSIAPVYKSFMKSSYPFEILSMLDFKLNALKLSEDVQAGIGIYMKDKVEFDTSNASKMVDMIERSRDRLSNKEFAFLHGVFSYFSSEYNLDYNIANAGGVAIVPVLESRRVSSVLFYQYVMPIMDMSIEELNITFSFAEYKKDIEKVFDFEYIKKSAIGRYDFAKAEGWFDIFSVARESGHPCNMAIESPLLAADINITVDAGAIYIYVQ